MPRAEGKKDLRRKVRRLTIFNVVSGQTSEYAVRRTGRAHSIRVIEGEAKARDLQFTDEKGDEYQIFLCDTDRVEIVSRWETVQPE